MSTLGYATLKILKGAGNPGFLHNIDKALVPEIGDIRGDLQALKVNYNEEPIVKIIKASERGTFIIIYKFYNSAKDNIRDYDGLSVWIYVPNEVNLKDNVLYNLVNSVERALSVSGIKEAELNDQLVLIFKGVEYESPGKPSINLRAKQTRNAFRYFDTRHNEHDVLGDLYQEYYCDYNLVFLLNKEDQSVRLSNPDVIDDLSDKRLESYTTLYVPEVPAGVDVYIDDNKTRRFKDSIRTKKDKEFTLTFSRSGFDDIRMKGNVEKLNNTNTNDLPWVKTIKKEQFRIYDVDTERKINDDFNLRILGRTVNQDIQIKESDLSIWKDDVQVQLSQFDIIDEETKIEEKYGSQYFIWVKRKFNEYQFDVSGEDTTITIRTSKRLKNVNRLPAYRIDWIRYLLTEISEEKETTKPRSNSGKPGKGSGNHNGPIVIPPYNPQNGNNTNGKPDNAFIKFLKNNWRPLAMTFVVIGACFGLFKYCTSHPTPKQLVGHEVVQAEEESYNSCPSASYLDKNDNWNKDSLDKYSNGLWDCINGSDFKAIKDKYHEIYEYSSKLKTLVALMEQLDGSYTHCPKGDFNISYQSLFDNLNKKINNRRDQEDMSENERATFNNSSDLIEPQTSNIKNKAMTDKTKEVGKAKGAEKVPGSDTDNSRDLSL